MWRMQMASLRASFSLVAALLLGAAAEAQESASSGGLIARLDLAGDPPVAAHAFDLRLHLSDAATGEPPRGLNLRSWVRPVEAGDPACTDAVRAFRATGSLPRGVIDLDAPVLAAAFSEGAVTLADPSLAEARATLRKAWAFSAPPAALASDPANGRFLMAFAETGEIVAMDASDGTLSLVAASFTDPATLVATPDGAGVWIGDAKGVHFARSDGVTTRLGPGVLASALPLGILVAGEGRLRLLDVSGNPLIEVAGDFPAAAVPDPGAPENPGGLAWVTGETLRVIWRSNAQQSIDLGATPDRLIAAEDGRRLYAIDSAVGIIAVVELSLGQVTEVIADLGFPVGEALLADDRLYLLAADASRVVVLNTRSEPGNPRWRRLTLGPAMAETGNLRQLLTASPSPGPVLALNPVNGLVSEIDAPEALGNAPQMTGFTLRGGRPIGLATQSRRWREGVDGEWRTRLAVPAGEHEIVLTGGVGLTLCLPLSVAGEKDETPTVSLLFTETPASGTGLLHFRLETTGAVLSPDTMPRITVAALSSGWRQSGAAGAVGGGFFSLPVTLPGPGLYSATPEVAGLVSRATTFEVD
jgi:hypothetical protein